MHVVITRSSHQFRTVLLMHLHQKATTNGQPYKLPISSSQIIKKWEEEATCRSTEATKVVAKRI